MRRLNLITGNWTFSRWQARARHKSVSVPGVVFVLVQAALNPELHRASLSWHLYFKKSPSGEGKAVTAETRNKYDKKH